MPDAPGSLPILGISADFHDAAAALVVGGRIVAAAEEERFSRHKHDASLPHRAIAWCLEEGGLERDELRHVVFYEKPLSAYDRILTTHALAGPRGYPQLAKALGSWTRRKLWVGYRIERLLRSLGQRRARVSYAEHHQSHAASAFYPSPYDRAAILVVDGVGEWTSSTLAWGAGPRIEVRQESRFPNSLGLLYSTFTALCGFEVNDGEYKLMGLAPYGSPRFVDVLRSRVVQVHDDGSVELDQRWFGYRTGRRMHHARLLELLDIEPRRPEDPLDERHADLARSIQVILEDAMVAMATHATTSTGERDLCLAGGVALNCVANERILERGACRSLWVQPAAGDGGGALGAALWHHHQVLDGPRGPVSGDAMRGAALGPSFDHEAVVSWLDAAGIRHAVHDDHGSLCEEVAARIERGAVVGWFQGPMEFGPRALGNRSILADPREVANVERINLLVKQREGFRPFAPAVLAEHAGAWFDIEGERPYMTVTAPVHDDQRRAAHADGVQGTGRWDPAARLSELRSTIPACTHVDGSARVQTVDVQRNPRFHALLEAFHRRTGCPVLVNTSFNRAGEPIVRSPADALRTFAAASLDVLVIERCLIERSALAEVS